ncbi:MAG: DNA adenine methylase [Spirochaetota bacterium]
MADTIEGNLLPPIDQPDFQHPYLTRQIIAYIGNKRKLLPLIYKAVKSCCPNIPPGSTFLDVFAGSGVVSRFARYLGFKVYSNDWEYFTYIINSAYLQTCRKDLPSMYSDFGGLKEVLEHLNNLPEPSPSRQYIARYYAPSTADIEKVDFRKQRLFYTRPNGLAIDKIRNRIEELYPQTRLDEVKKKEKFLLLALLLYRAATHTNTSGVFKAYHKGFGGHNRDAMRRITSPIVLDWPVLVDSTEGAEVFREDSNLLVRSKHFEKEGVDIAYIDPPYNQHQYGSNYHLLNTIARWDRIVVSNELDPNGVLKDKAGIRKDWVATRSKYCYTETALRAFWDLMEGLSARYILVSYSTDGIIPFEHLINICSRKGKVDIVTDRYIKYRGGKQSISRLNRNIEFVLIVDTGARSTACDMGKLEKVISEKRLALLFDKKYSRKKLEKHFYLDQASSSIYLSLEEGVLYIKTRSFLELIPPENIENLASGDLEKLVMALEGCVCENKQQELEEILSRLEHGHLQAKSDRVYLVKQVPDILRKMAHKKYRDIFTEWMDRVKEMENRHPEMFSVISSKLYNVQAVARKRFEN